MRRHPHLPSQSILIDSQAWLLHSLTFSSPFSFFLSRGPINVGGHPHSTLVNDSVVTRLHLIKPKGAYKSSTEVLAISGLVWLPPTGPVSEHVGANSSDLLEFEVGVTGKGMTGP